MEAHGDTRTLAVHDLEPRSRGPVTGHVVWDWNGTLFDDFPLLLASANAALAELGVEPIDAQRYRTEFHRPVRSFYARLVGNDLTDREWERVDQVFHAHYDELLHQASLAADAQTALNAVGDAGLSQSLLSMWRHERLVPHVRRLRIDSFFLRVDGLRGVAGGPKEPHLRAHLDAVTAELIRLEPDQVILVGDTVDDAAAANALGVRCVLYAGGEMPPERLVAAGVPVARSLLEALELSGILSAAR